MIAKALRTFAALLLLAPALAHAQRAQQARDMFDAARRLAARARH